MIDRVERGSTRNALREELLLSVCRDLGSKRAVELVFEQREIDKHGAWNQRAFELRSVYGYWLKTDFGRALEHAGTLEFPEDVAVFESTLAKHKERHELAPQLELEES